MQAFQNPSEDEDEAVMRPQWRPSKRAKIDEWLAAASRRDADGGLAEGHGLQDPSLPLSMQAPTLPFSHKSNIDSSGAGLDAEQVLQDLGEKARQQRIAAGQSALVHVKGMVARLASDQPAACERQLKEQRQIEELARLNT